MSTFFGRGIVFVCQHNAAVTFVQLAKSEQKCKHNSCSWNGSWYRLQKVIVVVHNSRHVWLFKQLSSTVIGLKCVFESVLTSGLCIAIHKKNVFLVVPEINCEQLHRSHHSWHTTYYIYCQINKFFNMEHPTEGIMNP